MKKRWLLVPVLLLSVPVLAFQAGLFPVFGALPTTEDQQRFSSSRAYNPEIGEFQNRRAELVASMQEEMEILPMLREWFKERPDGQPAVPLPERKPDMQQFMAPGSDTRIIWFGHSTFLVNMADTIILVDPVFGDTAAPVNFTAKRFQPPVLPLEDLPPVDIILISHDHYDHLEAQSVRFFSDKATSFIVPLGVGGHLRRWGVSAERITELDWWQSHDTDGLQFTATPAQHFSGRDGINNNQTLWASWVVASTNSRVFFSGDSGYDTHFADIGERLGPFDLALLENGQYDQSWPYVHMLPAETIQAFRDVKARRLMPVHWGMFELAFHTWYEPVSAVSLLAEQNGIELVTPVLGELITLDESLDTLPWWESLIEAPGP
ncbi:MBL fold metallo-hydrolase [Granulosicoccus sp. 3-233]|uniref:MBL fold metallo-hydrolase n=1 Tax=Granulosicoccus sp. 3-233 TaxID=3417969 RepID=UPI003D3502AD